MRRFEEGIAETRRAQILNPPGYADVFVHDRETGVTTRVNVSSGGFQSNGHCEELPISGDGRFVAFSSRAANLVPNDTNDEPDVFVRDLYTGRTVRASTNSVGVEAETSNDSPSISADGSWVVFSSRAANLVSDDTNDKSDIFIHRLLPPALYFAQFGDGGGALFSQIMLASLNDAEPANAKITLRDPGGQLLSVDLNGNEVAGELFPETDLSDFKGVLSVTAIGVVGATVIQTRPGQFATIPVAPRQTNPVREVWNHFQLLPLQRFFDHGAVRDSTRL